MSKEIALITPNQLIDEGIKHQLTQGDLLEIVADNRISEINRQINIFNKRADVIRENIRYKNVFSSFIDTFKLELEKILEREIDINNISIDTHSSDRGDYFSLYRAYISQQNAKTEILRTQHESFYLCKNINSTLVLKYTNSKRLTGTYGDIISNGSSTETYEKHVKITPKYIKLYQGYQKEMKEHNEEVKAYAETFKGVNLNQDKFIRDTRIAFNKQLLSSKSPDFKKKLKSFFNLELNAG